MPATAVGSANGQIDHESMKLFPGKAIAYQHPGDEQSGDGIHQRSDERCAEGERYEATTRGDGPLPERPPAHSGCLDKRRAERDQDDQRQIEKRVAERQAKAWQHAEGFLEVRFIGAGGRLATGILQPVAMLGSGVD